jgi:hypothetical protein
MVANSTKYVAFVLNNIGVIICGIIAPFFFEKSEFTISHYFSVILMSISIPILITALVNISVVRIISRQSQNQTT